MVWGGRLVPQAHCARLQAKRSTSTFTVTIAAQSLRTHATGLNVSQWPKRLLVDMMAKLSSRCL